MAAERRHPRQRDDVPRPARQAHFRNLIDRIAADFGVTNPDAMHAAHRFDDAPISFRQKREAPGTNRQGAGLKRSIGRFGVPNAADWYIVQLVDLRDRHGFDFRAVGGREANRGFEQRRRTPGLRIEPQDDAAAEFGRLGNVGDHGASPSARWTRRFVQIDSPDLRSRIGGGNRIGLLQKMKQRDAGERDAPAATLNGVLVDQRRDVRVEWLQPAISREPRSAPRKFCLR